METEFRLPLCIFQNHSLSSMPVCFQLVSLIYAEVTARGRAGNVARLGSFSSLNWTTLCDIKAALPD